MEAIITAIATVGFPIVAVLGLAWFIYTVWKKTNQDHQKQIESIAARWEEREDKLYGQLDKFNDSLNNFNGTLIRIDTRLECLEKREKC